jgi:hypothetical protein
MIALPSQVPTVAFAFIVAAFVVKQFLADFVLQTSWMAYGKEREAGWVVPLGTHAGIHAAATALIAAAAAPRMVWIALIDLVIHFAVDRAKAVASRRLKATPDRPIYWWLLGFDQSVHHLTHLGFSILLIAARVA